MGEVLNFVTMPGSLRKKRKKIFEQKKCKKFLSKNTQKNKRTGGHKLNY